MTVINAQQNRPDRQLKGSGESARLALLLAGFVALVSFNRPANADQEQAFLYSGGTYTLINGPDALFTSATDINDDGQIVGYYGDRTGGLHPFLDTAGTVTSIAVNGASYFGVRINDVGQIVGYYPSASFYYSAGTVTPFQIPGGRNGTIASDINNAGQIVGSYVDALLTAHGFLDTAGTITTIDVPGDKYGTILSNINNGGQIIGTFEDATFHSHAILYTAGTITLIDVPGAIYTLPTDINDAGEIVGYYSDVTGRLHDFLYAGGVFTTIGVPGSFYVSPPSINDAGLIVGTYQGNESTVAFLDTAGAITLIGSPGWENTTAAAINDAGQIVGTTYVPAPEPASIVLLLVGLAGLTLIRKPNRA